MYLARELTDHSLTAHRARIRRPRPHDGPPRLPACVRRAFVHNAPGAQRRRSDHGCVTVARSTDDRRCCSHVLHTRTVPAMRRMRELPTSSHALLLRLHNRRRSMRRKSPYSRSCSPICRRHARSASTRSAVQALSGVQLDERRPPTLELQATDTGGRACAFARRAASNAARLGRASQRACCSTSCARSRVRALRSAERANEQRRRVRSPATRCSPCARCAREISRGCRSPTPAAACTLAAQRVCRAPSRASPRSASRDDTRPVLTGILVHAAGQRAAHGRHGLLSPEREHDGARRRRSADLRGQCAGARPAGALAHRRAERRGACQRSASDRTRWCS